jgi:polyhydroxybutyrate depolymerase
MFKLISFSLIFLFLLIVGKFLFNSIPITHAVSKDKLFSMTHNNVERKYIVHVPKGYAPHKQLPLVMYIHGGGGNLRSAYLDKMHSMSDTLGFVLAIPEGTGGMKFGRIWGVWNGGSWQGGSCCGEADDVGFISSMIHDIQKNYAIDPNRIFATGISNGALMTNRLGCELSDTIAAIAVVAPSAVPAQCSPSKKLSVMVIQGTNDPANPLDGSEPRSIFRDKGLLSMPYKRMTAYETINAWKHTLGLNDTEPVPSYTNNNASCTAYKNTSHNSPEVELCVVTGMGHTFPSGAQYLPKSIVGPVSYDMSFVQMWEFFQKHPKN